jgi:hypothetical protein
VRGAGHEHEAMANFGIHVIVQQKRMQAQINFGNPAGLL